MKRMSGYSLRTASVKHLSCLLMIPSSVTFQFSLHTTLARVVTLAVAVMLSCGAAAVAIVHDMETTPPDIRIIGPLDDTNSFLGSSLAAGDINGDGIDDLAVGAHFESGGAEPGDVYVIYGSGSFPPGYTIDLTTESADLTLYGLAGYGPSRFGQRLLFGDVNGDGLDDLAVSAPLEYIGSQYYSGRVYVFFGSASFPPHLCPDSEINDYQHYPAVRELNIGLVGLFPPSPPARCSGTAYGSLQSWDGKVFLT